ncbi:hypothetical protein PFISCL1PPCAC_6847, partial [Pristionchus fissidentatus]
SILFCNHFISRMRLVLLLIAILFDSTAQSSTFYSNDDVLRKTIFLYSTGQSVKVQQAIAFTLRNRFISNKKEFGGKDLSKVCLQYWENARPEELDIPDHVEMEMNRWLERLMKGKMYDTTKGAIYFKFPDEKGYIFAELVKTTRIGKIDFFKDPVD